jgi:hypothetical protein
MQGNWGDDGNNHHGSVFVHSRKASDSRIAEVGRLQYTLYIQYSRIAEPFFPPGRDMIEKKLHHKETLY